MLSVDHYELIRRKRLVDGLSIRAISRELGHSRKTIRKALKHATPPGYQRCQPVALPVMDKVAQIVHGWLEQDRQRPPKQRHTAQRKGWQSSMHILQPATVVKWHRAGFKRYWRWRSCRKKPGRSKIHAEIRQLIKQMSTENPLWGAPRILSELQLLGHKVAERTVAKYMVRDEKPSGNGRH